MSVSDMLNRIAHLHPLKYALLALIFFDIAAATPFGISDTANTNLNSLSPFEWAVTLVFLPYVICLIVMMVRPRRRFMDWLTFSGGCLWVGVAVFSLLENHNSLDIHTNLALFLLPLGISMVHFAVWRVSVLVPGAVEGTDIKRI